MLQGAFANSAEGIAVTPNCLDCDKLRPEPLVMARRVSACKTTRTDEHLA